MKLSWLLVLLLLGLVAVFSVQNAEPITVHFLTWQITMSSALVIQLAALLGAFVGLVVGACSRRPRREPPAPAAAGQPAGLAPDMHRTPGPDDPEPTATDRT